MDNSEINNSEINLGGFPPIFFINNEIKKKREFEVNINNNIKVKNLNSLNILNIKDILNNSNKK
jgi:hypothetical protein